jgi:hypothetical protein
MGNQLWNQSTQTGRIQDSMGDLPKGRFTFKVDELIKIKKYPIENDYVIIKPPIGQGSYG